MRIAQWQTRLVAAALFALAPGVFAGGCGGEDEGSSDAAPKEDVNREPEWDGSRVITEEVGGGVIPDAGAAPDAAADASVDGPSAYARPEYSRLEETGFFGATGPVPAGDLLAFEPAHALWSDGSTKRRWVRLPPGTRIDTSEMDHWEFPIGTKVWKEFSRDGVPLETRLIERYGPGREDYWMGAFLWAADGRQATYTPDGITNAGGTGHDVPAAKVCGDCHRGDKGRVLGLSALQVAHERDGLNLTRLSQMGLLSHPPPEGAAYAVPGDPGTVSALGYLHANCGHCHNENGPSWPDTQMVLRLRVSEGTAAETDMVKSLIGRKLQSYRSPTLTQRVVAGDPEASALLARMKIRGNKDQMPSLATEVIDPLGVEAVSAWISSLAR